MATALFPRTGEPPESFGRYRILKKLGQGGMGAVYLAQDSELSRLVALKIPLAAGPESAERFRRAARAAAALQHPHICPIYESGAVEDVPYLTMAYIDGHTLAERLRGGRLSVAEAARWARALALALAEAHECGVIHRDVKPSNILINRRGEAILTDFGLADFSTPVYTAPEAMRGGAAGDLYSLGVVHYESLTGRPPRDDTPSEIDPRLEAIYQRATATDATGRYPDLTAFAFALAPFADAAPVMRSDENWSLPLSVGDAAVPLGEKRRRPSRWPWRFVVASAVGTAIILGGFYAFTQIKYLQSSSIPVAPAAPVPNAVPALIASAREEYCTDHYDEALADCAVAVGLDPNQISAWLLTAQTWHALGRRDKELAAYAEAWNAVKPATAEEYAGEVQIALGLGRPDDALQACNEALARDPHYADVFEARARALLAKGDKSRAAADYSRAADLMRPQEAQEYVARSILHELAGDLDRALADAECALQLAPHSAAALRQRGSVSRGNNDRSRAVADFTQALAVLAPRFAADYFDRAWLYNELGKYDLAAADLEQALSLGLKSGEVHRELAHAYRNRNDYDKAEAHLNEAWLLLPADATLYRERAALALARGRNENAIKDYTESLKLNPGDASLYVGRGNAYFRSGDDGRAVEDYSQALQRMTGAERGALADVYDRRGVAWARLKKYAEAAADYDRAIANDSGDPVLYLNRAVARKQTGDSAGADADLRKAEELRGPP